MKKYTKKTLFTITIGCATLLLLGANVRANAAWSGNIEGEQIIDGDSEGSRVRFSLSNNSRPLQQEVFADWIRSELGSSYAVGYEPQFWFNNSTYVFGRGSFRTSNDDSIDNITNFGGGLGLQLINTQTQELSFEVGAEQQSTKFDELFLPVDGGLTGDEDTLTETATFANAYGEQQISDLLKLSLDINYTDAETRTTTEARAGVKLGIGGGGSIVYSYRIRNDEIDGQEAIETTGSSVSFEYGF